MSEQGFPCRGCYYLASSPAELDEEGNCSECSGAMPRTGSLAEVLKDFWNGLDPGTRGLIVTGAKILKIEAERRGKR